MRRSWTSGGRSATDTVPPDPPSSALNSWSATARSTHSVPSPIGSSSRVRTSRVPVPNRSARPAVAHRDVALSASPIRGPSIAGLTLTATSAR
jgi:hypothetical protein